MEPSPMVFLEPEWPLYLPPNDEDLGGGDGGALGVVRYDGMEPPPTVFLEPEWPLYLPPYDEDLGGGDGGILGVVRCDTWSNPGGNAVESHDEKRD